MSFPAVSVAAWALALEDAAGAFNGGPRSFPPSRDRDIADDYAYQPPNDDYEDLLLSQVQSPQISSSSASAHSAGWLLPSNLSVCRPVLVAHSILAAIWLIRNTLPDDAVPSDVWQQLVSAALDCAGDVPIPSSTAPPPSAQRPLTSPLPHLNKRVAAGVTDSPSPTSKRLRKSGAAPSEPPSALQEVNISQPSELAATPQLTAPAAAPHQHVVTSITNHNRRAERERAKKQGGRKINIQMAAGLVAPPQEAAGREHKAYALVEPEDAAHVSWLLKQTVEGDNASRTAVNLFNSAATPYAVAVPMLHKARCIGDASSWDSVAAFLRQWRAHGTPFGHNIAEATLHPPVSSRDSGSLPPLTAENAPFALSSTTVGALAAAWTLCDRYEQELDVIHIKYRWAMAFLGKVYMDKVQEISRQEGAVAAKGVAETRKKGRGGQGKVSTEAINTIIAAVLPSTSQPEQLRQRFRRRLYRALSWYKIAGELGWGMLCLMPHENISNSWIENDLRASHILLWCKLVTRVNPAACAASWALERWLGSEGVAGGSICDKETLCIEDIAASCERLGALSQVTKVGGSEDDEEDRVSRDSRDNCVDSGEEVERTNAPIAAKALRQRTLLELFQPQL